MDFLPQKKKDDNSFCGSKYFITVLWCLLITRNHIVFRGLIRSIPDIVDFIDLCYSKALTTLNTITLENAKTESRHYVGDQDLIVDDTHTVQLVNVTQTYVDGVWNKDMLKGGGGWIALYLNDPPRKQGWGLTWSFDHSALHMEGIALF